MVMHKFIRLSENEYVFNFINYKIVWKRGHIQEYYKDTYYFDQPSI